MLSRLLSSKPKSKLVNLLLAHPGRAFSLTELRASSGCGGRMLLTALGEMRRMEFIETTSRAGRKYYRVNRHFVLYPELVALLSKAKQVPKDRLAEASRRVGNCRLVVLTGIFSGHPRLETDVLFVGQVGRGRLSKFLQFAAKMAEAEVNYTVLTPAEFAYRQTMNDRFVKNILENEPVTVVNKTKHRK